MSGEFTDYTEITYIYILPECSVPKRLTGEMKVRWGLYRREIRTWKRRPKPPGYFLKRPWWRRYF